MTSDFVTPNQPQRKTVGKVGGTHRVRKGNTGKGRTEGQALKWAPGGRITPGNCPLGGWKA